MHLLINAIPVAPGGGLSVLLGLLDGWRQIGADLGLTVLAARPETCAALRQAGWGEITKEIRAGGTVRARLWQRFALPRLVRELKPDVLLTNNYFVGRCPCPQVVHHQSLWTVFATGYGPYLRRWPRRLAQTLGARAALRRADANVFISGYLRACAEAIDPESRSRNHVIYNGLNEQYVRASEETGPPADLRYAICALQSPVPHKDNASLFRGFAQVVQSSPQHPWRLTVAGGGDWGPWQKLADNLGIGSRVTFVGHQSLPAIADLFRASDCLVYPSAFEGFGLPIIEAMACGCPVVAVRATAIPEVAGEAAILVEPHSPGAIAAGIMPIYQDQALRAELIDLGRRRVGQFAWADSARAFMDVFKTVAKS